jgi:hypothetical protein
MPMSVDTVTVALALQPSVAMAVTYIVCQERMPNTLYTALQTSRGCGFDK